MKIYLILSLLFLGAALAVVSCTKKVAVAEEVSQHYFVLGSGGGVTGLYEQYKVEEDGTIYLYDFEMKKYLPYTTLSASANKKTWDTLESLNLMNKKFDRSGNFTYYIELVDGESRNKIKWSDENKIPDESIRTFFRDTERLLKNTK